MRRLVDVMGATVLAVALASVPVRGVQATAATGEIGPRPDRLVRSVLVPPLDAVFAFEANDPYSGASIVWSYGLNENRWRTFALSPSNLVVGRLAYLPDRREVISVPDSPGSVAILDLVTREWRTLDAPMHRPVDVTDIAVDTKRGHVFAWSDSYDELWTYDPAANRWTKVRRQSPSPSGAWDDTGHGYTLFTYDRAADRAVLAVLPIPGGRAGSTWLFDPESGGWMRARSRPPQLNYGWGEMATSAVYDAAHARTVLFTYGQVATYDSARDRWQLPSRDSWPIETDRSDGLASGPLVRFDHQVLADPERGRVLVFGGSSLVDLPDNDPPYDFEWRPDASMWAYDVGANTWSKVDAG